MKTSSRAVQSLARTASAPEGPTPARDEYLVSSRAERGRKGKGCDAPGPVSSPTYLTTRSSMRRANRLARTPKPTCETVRGESQKADKRHGSKERDARSWVRPVGLRKSKVGSPAQMTLSPVLRTRPKADWTKRSLEERQTIWSTPLALNSSYFST